MELPVHAAQVLAVHVGVDLRRSRCRRGRASPARRAGRRLPRAGAWRTSAAGCAATGLGDARPSSTCDGGSSTLPCASSGSPRALRNRMPRPAPRSRRGRSSRRYTATAPDGAPPDGHQPLLAPLAEDAHELLVEQGVLHGQPDPLGHAQPRAVGPARASRGLGRTSGSSSDGAASSRSTSATVSTSGSVRQRAGASRRSLGSRRRTPHRAGSGSTTGPRSRCAGSTRARARGP
jgi:hypothetical protein